MSAQVIKFEDCRLICEAVRLGLGMKPSDWTPSRWLAAWSLCWECVGIAHQMAVPK